MGKSATQVTNKVATSLCRGFQQVVFEQADNKLGRFMSHSYYKAVPPSLIQSRCKVVTMFLTAAILLKTPCNQSNDMKEVVTTCRRALYKLCEHNLQAACLQTCYNTRCDSFARSTVKHRFINTCVSVVVWHSRKWQSNWPE